MTIFTNKVSTVATHYVELPNLRSELRCNTGLESRCLLCDLKYRLTNRAILPVYDIAAAEVKVLLVSDTRDPHSLGPQLKAELRQGGLDERYLVALAEEQPVHGQERTRQAWTRHGGGRHRRLPCQV